MANPQLLEERWKASGKKKMFLAEKLNVSRPRLNAILTHPETATVGQANILSAEFHLTSAESKNIFLP